MRRNQQIRQWGASGEAGQVLSDVLEIKGDRRQVC